MTKPIKNYTAKQIDALSSSLGEGITASLRKFCASEASTKARDAIYAMPDREWANGVLLPVIEHSIIPWIEKNQATGAATETGDEPGEKAKFVDARSLQVGDFLTLWSEEREVTHVGFPDSRWLEVGVKDQGETYLINLKQSDKVLMRPKPEKYAKGTVVVRKGAEAEPLTRGMSRWTPSEYSDAQIAAQVRAGVANVIYTPKAKS